MKMALKIWRYDPLAGERALREYEVLGIQTTIPFFLWLMRQPEYIEGRYDTTYLDRLLAGRNGESFSELTEQDEELASIAAALDTYLRVNASSRRAAAGGTREASSDGRDRAGFDGRPSWKHVARREALRG